MIAEPWLRRIPPAWLVTRGSHVTKVFWSDQRTCIGSCAVVAYTPVGSLQPKANVKREASDTNTKLATDGQVASGVNEPDFVATAVPALIICPRS